MTQLAANLSAEQIQSDESLIWSLAQFEEQQRVVEFAQSFGSSLCVYSPKVQQVYARYELVVPERMQEIVVVPDLDAFTETFYDVSPESLLKTNYTIVPGSAVGQSGLCIYIPMADGKGRVVQLEQGLRAISNGFRDKGDAFLPVLMKGDLQTFNRKEPALHLHRIDLKALHKKSRFELNDLKTTIREKLTHLPV